MMIVQRRFSELLLVPSPQGDDDDDCHFSFQLHKVQAYGKQVRQDSYIPTFTKKKHIIQGKQIRWWQYCFKFDTEAEIQ